MFNKTKNITKKITSVALIFSMVTNMFGALADDPKPVFESPTPILQRLEDEAYKELSKNTPVITLLGATAAGLAIAGGAALGYKISQKLYLRDVSTIVDGMTNKEIIEYRDKQIEKFKRIGGDTFEIDPKFIGELPPKAVALILREINSIFESYPNITRELIAHWQRRNLKFSVSASDSFSSRENVNATTTMTTMVFNKDAFSYPDSFLCNTKFSIISGLHPPADFNKLVESIVAHEMGHLIQKNLVHLFIVCYAIASHQRFSFKAPKDEIYAVDGEAMVYSTYALMKKEIIDIAKQFCDYNGDGRISEYGEKNDEEWFAEVTSHCLCSKKPNALGHAFKLFLDVQEGDLKIFYAAWSKHLDSQRIEHLKKQLLESPEKEKKSYTLAIEWWKEQFEQDYKIRYETYLSQQGQ